MKTRTMKVNVKIEKYGNMIGMWDNTLDSSMACCTDGETDPIKVHENSNLFEIEVGSVIVISGTKAISLDYAITNIQVLRINEIDELNQELTIEVIGEYDNGRWIGTEEEVKELIDKYGDAILAAGKRGMKTYTKKRKELEQYRMAA